MALQPEAPFQKCFQEWIASGVQADESGERRRSAIDGKSCRRSHDASNDLGALHIVSAWASEQGIALGQVAAEDKSNEITAIPLLLDQLDLTDAAGYHRRDGLSKRDRPEDLSQAKETSFWR